MFMNNERSVRPLGLTIVLIVLSCVLTLIITFALSLPALAQDGTGPISVIGHTPRDGEKSGTPLIGTPQPVLSS
jgi:hypothetical protein